MSSSRRWNIGVLLPNMMHVYALGYHVGNDIKDYEFMWHDGTTKTWRRPG